ncbi:MAG TPA: hypothetical protein ENI94_12320 [Gammaproteobacteria bacterium]|nr:hypothetical protein [Gammaproteobacteria bacterium]
MKHQPSRRKSKPEYGNHLSEYHFLPIPSIFFVQNAQYFFLPGCRHQEQALLDGERKHDCMDAGAVAADAVALTPQDIPSPSPIITESGTRLFVKPRPCEAHALRNLYDKFHKISGPTQTSNQQQGFITSNQSRIRV